EEGVEQHLGQRRLILVGEGDGGVAHLVRRPGGLRVDRERERIEHEHDHDGVADQAPDLLDAEIEDVLERLHRYFSCFLSPSMLSPSKIGMDTARTMRSLSMRAGPSPFV